MKKNLGRREAEKLMYGAANRLTIRATISHKEIEPPERFTAKGIMMESHEDSGSVFRELRMLQELGMISMLERSKSPQRKDFVRTDSPLWESIMKDSEVLSEVFGNK